MVLMSSAGKDCWFGYFMEVGLYISLGYTALNSSYFVSATLPMEDMGTSLHIFIFAIVASCVLSMGGMQ